MTQLVWLAIGFAAALTLLGLDLAITGRRIR